VEERQQTKERIFVAQRVLIVVSGIFCRG